MCPTWNSKRNEVTSPKVFIFFLLQLQSNCERPVSLRCTFQFTNQFLLPKVTYLLFFSWRLTFNVDFVSLHTGYNVLFLLRLLLVKFRKVLGIEWINNKKKLSFKWSLLSLNAFILPNIREWASCMNQLMKISWIK